MNTWFTSDPHYFHKNVIEYCNRPFSSVEEMNEALIENYNSVVKPEDMVYILGDVIFGGTEKANSILSRLNGEKHLIIGNHDARNKGERKWLNLGFKSAKWNDRFDKFLLSHFPYKNQEPDARTFKDQLEDKGDWLLHGHVHGLWKQKGRMINVGVDVWDFKPVHYDTLLQMRK